MEKRDLGDGVTVNDGNGFLDNDGLMETIIKDANEAVKGAMSGNYILFCDRVVQIVSKVSLLRKNYKREMDEKTRQIEELKLTNHNLLEGITGLPDEYGQTNTEKDGAGNGSN